MPRPERPVDATAGPIQAFAQELRDLRESAGRPKYLQMARATGRSRTSLAEAAGGDHLPTWDTVEAFVRYCQGDLLAWRMRWEQVRAQARPGDQPPIDHAPRPPAPPPATPAPPTPDRPTADLLTPDRPTVGARPRPAADESDALRSGRRRRRFGQVVATVFVGVVAVGGGYWAGLRDDQPAEGRRPPSSAAITVHNKVAIGASGLAEDSTPSYLSTKPVPRCASRGCKIAGTEVWSGAELVARCWIRGEKMTNRDLTSENISQNPAGVSSDLWYEIVLHDGRAGYLSEVYIAPQHRGGMSLPECPRG